MFLKLPTIEELLLSDMDELIDMLLTQSGYYKRMIELEGKSPRTKAIQELIERLQQAIQLKKTGLRH